MEKTIALIRGDGIGPEIVEAAEEALDAVSHRFGHHFYYSEVLLGGAAIDATGEPLPEASLQACRGAHAVLMGAIGGPKWDGQPKEKRPETGLLALRKGLGLYANLRPARLLGAVKAACPLRADIVKDGFDFLMVRELTGGVYFGEHRTETKNGEKIATDIMSYSENEIRRILHVAFKTAQSRRQKVTSVDKANVLDTSRLWRALAEEVAKAYPDVAFENMLVDNAAMQIVKNPAAFDVLVTENLFGDILSDEASMVTGSIGLIPSASLGEGGIGLYEPIHGSAPDIAGLNKANPLGTILSAAMLLRYSLGLETEAQAIEQAAEAVLRAGVRTADIFTEGCTLVGCHEMGEHVAKQLLIQ